MHDSSVLATCLRKCTVTVYIITCFSKCSGTIRYLINKKQSPSTFCRAVWHTATIFRNIVFSHSSLLFSYTIFRIFIHFVSKIFFKKFLKIGIRKSKYRDIDIPLYPLKLYSLFHKSSYCIFITRKDNFYSTESTVL